MQQPTVYDHRNVYDTGAGGGSSINISDFFNLDIKGIYHNNTNNNISPHKLIKPVNNDDFELEGEYYIANPLLSESPGNFFTLNTSSSFNSLVYLYGQGISNPRMVRFGNNYTSKDISYNFVANEYSLITISPTEIKLNNTNIKITSTPGVVSLTHLWPVPTNNNNAHGNNYKISVKKISIKKISTNEYVAVFVAAIRKSDNAVGLFNYVTGGFYTDSYLSYYA